MDAYRETIHKPLPKDGTNLPEAKLQASADAASEQYKKLKAANTSTKDEVGTLLTHRQKIFLSVVMILALHTFFRYKSV